MSLVDNKAMSSPLCLKKTIAQAIPRWAADLFRAIDGFVECVFRRSCLRKGVNIDIDLTTRNPVHAVNIELASGTRVSTNL